MYSQTEFGVRPIEGEMQQGIIRWQSDYSVVSENLRSPWKWVERGGEACITQEKGIGDDGGVFGIGLLGLDGVPYLFSLLGNG